MMQYWILNATKETKDHFISATGRRRLLSRDEYTLWFPLGSTLVRIMNPFFEEKIITLLGSNSKTVTELTSSSQCTRGNRLGPFFQSSTDTPALLAATVMRSSGPCALHFAHLTNFPVRSIGKYGNMSKMGWARGEGRGEASRTYRTFAPIVRVLHFALLK